MRNSKRSRKFHPDRERRRATQSASLANVLRSIGVPDPEKEADELLGFVPRLRNFARRKLRDPDTVDDVLSETLLGLYEWIKREFNDEKIADQIVRYAVWEE